MADINVLTAQVIDPTGATLGDGSQPPLVAGKGGELLTSELHARYYTMAYRGRLFTARTAHGGATIPKYDATAYTWALLNPAGSGVNLELLFFEYDQTGSATQVVGSFLLNWITSPAIDVVLQGTCTLVTGGVQNRLLGTGVAPKSSLYSATTWVAQTDNTGIPLGGFMATALSPNVFIELAGSIIVPPDTMIGLVCTPAAQTGAGMVSLTYAEVAI